jgi:hypothetical protein
MIRTSDECGLHLLQAEDILTPGRQPGHLADPYRLNLGEKGVAKSYLSLPGEKLRSDLPAETFPSHISPAPCAGAWEWPAVQRTSSASCRNDNQAVQMHPIIKKIDKFSVAQLVWGLYTVAR